MEAPMDAELLAKCWRIVAHEEITVRLDNCLRNADIKYIGELAQKTRRELLKLSNFGPRTLREVEQLLTKLGMCLEMQLGDWASTPPTRNATESPVRGLAERQILTAIAQMPFGASVHSCVGQNGSPVTLEQIGTYLGELRDVLLRNATMHAAEHAELQRLRADLAAVRRVFGIGAQA